MKPPKTSQHVESQVASIKTTNPYQFREHNRQFTPLLDTLHSIMLQILVKSLITLPPIRTIDPTKPLPLNYNANGFSHYRQQNGHDTKHCKHLKHILQDLIGSYHNQIGFVNDQGNISVAPPN